MQQGLTIKFSPSMMKGIREKSCAKKISQGAFVREAIQHYLGCSENGDADDFDFNQVTRDMLSGKAKKKVKRNVLDEIRAHFATLPPPELSAEEEVRRSRTRGLL